MSVKEISLNGTLTLGLTSTPDKTVTCQVTGFTLQPAASVASSPATACQGSRQKIAGKSSWSVAFNYVQDWGATDSLSQMLFDNDGGTPIFFDWTPADNTVPKATGSFEAVAGAYGGQAEQVWVNTGQMPVVGTPTFTTQS